MAYTVIDHTELSGTTASWSKTSIPSSYDHLYLVWSARSNHSANRDSIYCNVNGDTSSSDYSMTHLFSGLRHIGRAAYQRGRTSLTTPLPTFWLTPLVLVTCGSRTMRRQWALSSASRAALQRGTPRPTTLGVCRSSQGCGLTRQR